MFPDLGGQVALVTGGTRGLGLASALALGRHGAHVWMTHRWGSADEQDLQRRFAEAGAPAPTIVQADAASEDDTHSLFDAIASRHQGLDLLVVNACVAAVGGSLASLRPRDLARCLQASAFALPQALTHCRRALGALPARVVAMSSDGVAVHHPRYDFVALAKAALEAVAAGTDTAVFILRTRQAVTGGFEEIFGADALAVLARYARFAVAPDQVADAVLACASGYLDGLAGQPLQIDHGAGRLDNVLTAGGLG